MLMGKKKFVAVMLDLEHEIFVVHVVSLSSITSFNSFLLNVHLFCRLHIANLIVEKAFTIVPNKYVDFVNVFFLDFVSKLFKHTEINNHSIELLDN